jgi:hypothetical protein
MANDKQLAQAFGDLFLSSFQLTFEVGRLGVINGVSYDIAVPDRPGFVYVTRGDFGELGPTVARDKVGVAQVGWQRVKMRRINGQLEIHEAEQYAGGAGATTLSTLTDVQLTGLADGEGLAWDSGTSKWVNVALSGGGGAPSPHDLDGVHHSGLLSWTTQINFTGSNLADLDSRAHSSLSGIGANDHHAQQHDILGSDHTITASQYQLVGGTGVNTLGLLTPSSSPGAAVAILRTDANGGIALDTSLLVVDGSANTVNIDSGLFLANASTNIVTFDTTLLVVNATSDAVTFDGALLVVNASTDIVAFDTTLLTVNAATDVVAFASTLLTVNAAANTVAFDTSVMVVDATANTVTFDTSVLVVSANADTVTMDGTLFIANASTDIVTFDGTVLVVNAATDIVTFDTTLLIVNAAANTITMDGTLFVLDAGANTITSAAAWTFSGNIVANAAFTHNTGVFTHNTDPQVFANLDFMGGDRSITASNNLTIAPSTDLVLDPTGNVRLPIAQQVITDTFSDTIAGILGYRNFHLGGNVRQISIGKIVADEMFVRAFTYDEIRANRGQEFWGRSFGIVDTEFTLPADEANVDVWFEEAPDLGTAKLFMPDNWLLCRSVDLATGLTVLAVWFQVVDADGPHPNNVDYVQRQNADPANGIPVSRQQWRLKRKSGGTTGAKIRRGNVIVDFGKPNSVLAPGQGIVHISALDTNGGPFVQIQRFMSVSSDVPQLVTLTRMGHLSGFAGQPAGLYGFGMGNDGSLSASGGSFSGILNDQTNGTRMYNVALTLYDGSSPMITMDKSTGINLDFDISPGATLGRYIRWLDDVTTFDINSATSIGGYKDSGNNTFQLRTAGPTASTPALRSLVEKMTAGTPTAWSEFRQLASSYRFYFDASQSVMIDAGSGNVKMGIGLIVTEDETDILATLHVMGSAIVRTTLGVGTTSVASIGHFYENTANVGATAGLTIEQDGTGDAIAQFLLTDEQRWVIGTDNSDSDAFKLASGTDLGTNTIFRIDPALTIGLGRDTTVSGTFGVTGIATVGNTTYAEPYTGFTAQGNKVVVVRYATAHATSTPYTGFVFANNVTDTTDGVHSFLVFQNEAIAAAEQRIAQLVMRTDNGLDGGQFRFMVADAGSLIDAMTIRKTGYVGIGTADPGTNITGTFDFAGSTLLQVGGTTPALLVHGSTSASLDLIDTGASANARRFQILKDGNYTYFNTIDDAGGLASAAVIIDNFNNTWGMFAIPLADSFVAISSDTTRRPLTLDVYGSPQYHLMMRRAGNVLGSPTAIGGAGSVLGSVGAIGYTSGGWASATSAEISFRSTEAFNTGTGGKGGAEMLFYTRANGAAGVTERMRITQDGQVGIRIAPVSILHIYQNDAETSTGAGMTIEQDGGGDAMLQFYLTNSTRWAMGIDNSTTGDPFVIAPSVLGAGALAINTTGQVGIGLYPSASARLLVATDGSENSIWLESYGTANVPSIRARASRGSLGTPSANASGDVLFILQGGGYYTSGGTGYGDTASISFVATQTPTASARGTKITFQVTPDGGTSRSPVFEILQDGGLIAPNVYGHTVGATNRDLFIDNTGRIGYVVSSARYKSNIRPLPASYDDNLILSLDPVSFVYKSEPTVPQIGFIAENVAALGANELVVWNRQGEVESIHYNRMVVPLWASQQRLLRRVSELERMVADLQERTH